MGQKALMQMSEDAPGFQTLTWIQVIFQKSIALKALHKFKLLWGIWNFPAWSSLASRNKGDKDIRGQVFSTSLLLSAGSKHSFTCQAVRHHVYPRVSNCFSGGQKTYYHLKSTILVFILTQVYWKVLGFNIIYGNTWTLPGKKRVLPGLLTEQEFTQGLSGSLRLIPAGIIHHLTVAKETRIISARQDMQEGYLWPFA